MDSQTLDHPGNQDIESGTDVGARGSQLPLIRNIASFLPLALFIFWPRPCLALDLTTRNGATYKHFEVTRVEPDGIIIRHEDGVSKVSFEYLPQALQELYHYDPAKAAKYRREIEAAKEARRKAALDAEATNWKRTSDTRGAAEKKVQQVNEDRRAREEGRHDTAMRNRQATEPTLVGPIALVGLFFLFLYYLRRLKSISRTPPQRPQKNFVVGQPESVLHAIDRVEFDNNRHNLFRLYLSRPAREYPMGGEVSGVFLSPSRKVNLNKERIYQQRQFLQISEAYLDQVPWVPYLAALKHAVVIENFEITTAAFPERIDKEFFEETSNLARILHDQGAAMITTQAQNDLINLVAYQDISDDISAAIETVERIVYSEFRSAIISNRLHLPRPRLVFGKAEEYRPVDGQFKSDLSIGLPYILPIFAIGVGVFLCVQSYSTVGQEIAIVGVVALFATYLTDCISGRTRASIESIKLRLLYQIHVNPLLRLFDINSPEEAWKKPEEILGKLTKLRDSGTALQNRYPL